MPFTQRNLYYLRASPHIVLQTVLYLDPKHLRWMNAYYGDGDENDEDEEEEGRFHHPAGRYRGDLVLAKALQVLKTRIMPKLRSESQEGGPLGSTNKKEQVDVHVDVDFQMAYFFKKVPGRHAVLLKEKSMKFPQTRAQNRGAMAPPDFPASAAKRQRQQNGARQSNLAARQDLQAGDSIVEEGAEVAEENDPEQLGGEEASSGKRKRGLEVIRVRIKQEEVDDDDGVEEVQPLDGLNGPLGIPRVKQEHEEDDDEGTGQEAQSIDVDDTEADEDLVEDKKPKIHVNYSGFKIFGKMLVLVIEPSRQMKRRVPELFTAPSSSTAPAARPASQRISETPVPSSSRAPADLSSMRSPSRARSSVGDGDDDEEAHPRDSRSISRGLVRNTPLFRGTPSEYEPTPTPEPESRQIREALQAQDDDDDDQGDEQGEEEQVDQSSSFLLASQMLEDGAGGEGNDIDDDAGD